MQGQGKAAQSRPKQIAVTEMSLLMGQRMAQRGLVLPQSGRQINSRAKDSGQAWRFQPWAAVDRQPGICIFQALTAPAQAEAEPQLRPQHRTQHRSGPGTPDPGQNVGPSNRRRSV